MNIHSAAAQFALIIAVTLWCLVLYPMPAMAQTAATTGLRSGDTMPNPSQTAPLLRDTIISGQSGTGQTSIGQTSIDGVRLQLIALLTERGPQIRNGVVWRIFTPDAAGGNPDMIQKLDTATPTVELQPGLYLINAAFGLAHLTRTVRVSSGAGGQEKFIINAGGLRIAIRPSSGKLIGLVNARFDLLNDERDQFGNRQLLLSDMRPGQITRLNAGIYRIVSRLGDANAIVSSEVTVEAGKLTEATVLHEAAKVTFKLAQWAGGDALAGAQWTITSDSGKIVKETAGALPTHILAPGSYTVSVRWAGRLYTRPFSVKSGDNVEVEVLIR